MAFEGLTLSFARFYGQPIESFIEQAAEMGFESVQLLLDQEPNLYSTIDAGRLARVKDAMAVHKMNVSVHNVFYDINLVSVVPAVHNLALSITRKVLLIAEALCAQSLTVHLGYLFPGWRRDSAQLALFWRMCQESIRKVDALAKSSRVKICIENGSYYLTTKHCLHPTPLHFGIELDELSQIISRSEALSVCLDVAKALASDQRCSDFWAQFPGRIGQVQFSRSEHLYEIASCVPIVSAILNGSIEVVFEGSACEIRNLAEALSGGSFREFLASTL